MELVSKSNAFLIPLNLKNERMLKLNKYIYRQKNQLRMDSFLGNLPRRCDGASDHLGFCDFVARRARLCLKCFCKDNLLITQVKYPLFSNYIYIYDIYIYRLSFSQV